MEEFQSTQHYDVSRETSQKLSVLAALVRKWSRAINLIGRETLADIETRHIGDSLFLTSCKDGADDWLDLGSGAGFPGLVVAIQSQGNRHVTLVESDLRKCEFLSAVKRELSLNVNVIRGRIEEIKPQKAPVISARALAPLPKLLEFCFRHAVPSSTLLLPKGENWPKEVDDSRTDWSYDLDVLENPVAAGSVVLKIENLARMSV